VQATRQRPWTIPGGRPDNVHGIDGKTMAKQVLVGRTGTVVIPIRGGDRPGEVRLTVDGMAHYYLAYAATAIPADASVLVINDRGARHIDVEPWPTVPADGDARGRTEGSP
jgi:membrane protein implicated in regulation of membrane protease activity